MSGTMGTHHHIVQFMKRILPKGIGVHHAGLLPILKEVVETLFGMGLISVLYATETFAVGINMPARSVAFNTLDKYDGRSFRHLFSKEYLHFGSKVVHAQPKGLSWELSVVLQG